MPTATGASQRLKRERHTLTAVVRRAMGFVRRRLAHGWQYTLNPVRRGVATVRVALPKATLAQSSASTTRAEHTEAPGTPSLPVLWRPRAGRRFILWCKQVKPRRLAIPHGLLKQAAPWAGVAIVICIAFFMGRMTNMGVGYRAKGMNPALISSFDDIKAAVIRPPPYAIKKVAVKKGGVVLSLPALMVFASRPDLQAQHDNLDITSTKSLWYRAGERYGVDPLLIYAVALVESRAVQPDGEVAPTPWMVRINQVIHEGSRADVTQDIMQAEADHQHIQDVGIMQVYWPMHRSMAPDPVTLLDPRTNIDVGTRILAEALRESADPILAVGYYHSHDPMKARFYGRAVYTVYRRLQELLDRATVSSFGAAGQVATASVGPPLAGG